MVKTRVITRVGHRRAGCEMRTREKGSSHESAGTKQSVRLSVLSGQQTVGREFTPCTPPTHEISPVGTAERAELHPSVARAGLGSDVLAGLAWDSGRIQGVNSLPIFSRPYGTEKWLSPPHSKNVVRRFWLANQDRLLAVIRRPHDIVCADEFGVETGMPSSKSIPITSRRFSCSSSSDSPWEWAPGNPGT